MKQVAFLLCSVLGFLMVACNHKPMQVTSIETEILPVDSSLDAIQDSDYLAYLAPIKEKMEDQLNIPLGYAPQPMSVGKPESTLLNWATDALYEMALLNYDGQVDVAVVNAGGLRCDWPAGDITFRNVFELMPFDNELVILTLSGEDLLLLAQNCVQQGGQGISKQMRVEGSMKGQDVLAKASLHGKEIDPAATYHVATSDYLSGGADGLTALTHFSERVMTGKKIRDLYIEYIALLTKENQPVAAELDGRMSIL